jgi:hypothetical protein
MSYTVAEMQEQPLRVLQVRVKQSRWYPSFFFIQYKRKWYSPWRSIKVFPCQFRLPSRMPNTYLLDTLMLNGKAEAERIAAGFKTETDIAFHYAYLKHLHEKVYENADGSSMYMASAFANAVAAKMLAPGSSV